MTENPLRPLEGLLRSIADLASRNDLAAVLLHLNDTYQIEERPPDIPGMARIAEAVRLVRGWVGAITGENRTLVVHSGDFLSPSFMTTKLGFAGKQMVEMLNHCGVDYATVGNHEFDVTPDELRQRFREADFRVVNANLVPPPGFADVLPLVLWPEREPFLAIVGLSGAQTRGKGVRSPYNWRESDWRAALEAQLEEVQARPEIGALALLSHMDRDEDKELQDFLNEKWRKPALAFILGGHDHDIDWQEPGRRCILCKNLSNASTLTAIALSKSAIAAPAEVPGPSNPYATREEMGWLRHLRDIEREWEAGARPEWAEPFERILERTIAVWRDIAPGGLRQDFKDAFERLLHDEATNDPPSSVEKSHFLDQGAEHILIDRAVWSAVAPYQHGGGGSAIFVVDWRGAAASRDRHSAAQAAVDGWVEKMEAQIGAQGRERIADFRANVPEGRRMDARDEALRTGSTDFGNFVADAIEIATGAELALINAGCLRLDGAVGPEITVRDLQETFLYDRPNAIVMVELTAAEVQAVLEHALTKSGGGGFLQVSRGVERFAPRDEPFRTALVAHMLLDDEDKYQSLLARLRGCEPDELPGRLAMTPQGAMLDLVARGARIGVSSSGRSRLSGQTVSDELESAQRLFAEHVDRLIGVCRAQGVQQPVWELDPDVTRPARHQHVSETRRFVRLVILQLAMSLGFEWIKHDLYKHAGRSALRYRRGIPYETYLDKAMAYFDFHVPFRRLKDEEGQHEQPEARAIVNRISSRRAETIRLVQPETWLDTFAEAVDEYVSACSAEGTPYPQCRQWLVADPRRAPPTETIRRARLHVRHVLLFFILDWGMERVRGEFAQAMGESDARKSPPTSYQADLVAALTYFDIVVPYGLLEDEEYSRAPPQAGLPPGP